MSLDFKILFRNVEPYETADFMSKVLAKVMFPQVGTVSKLSGKTVRAWFQVKTSLCLEIGKLSLILSGK